MSEIQLSDSLRTRLEILGNEVKLLHADWKLYSQCFCHSQERSDLLHDSASGFFSRVHTMMLWSIVVSISRLLDPGKTGKNINLVIESLISELGWEANEKLFLELEADLSAMRELAGNIRTFRHKRVGHLDESVLLGEKKLEEFSPKNIPSVLGSMDQFLNKLNVLLPESAHVVYDAIYIIDDGDTLARRLSIAKAVDKLIVDGVITREQVRDAGGNDA
jgi:HEPN superfamily AbiU2-like protein